MRLEHWVRPSHAFPHGLRCEHPECGEGKAVRLPVAHRNREHAARPVSGLSNWNAGVPAHRLPEPMRLSGIRCAWVRLPLRGQCRNRHLSVAHRLPVTLRRANSSGIRRQLTGPESLTQASLPMSDELRAALDAARAAAEVIRG